MHAAVPPPPTISASWRTTMPFCGGVEAYNERSLRVRYRSQGVETSFYHSTPSAQDPLGCTNSQGLTEDSGNARANIPNASFKRMQSQIYLQTLQGSTQTYSWYARLLEGGIVIDLKQLNDHASHFHMHTMRSVMNTVKRGDYVFKINLQDAYFHVMIHPNSRKYLQFRVHPFGLNTSPQVFTLWRHRVAATLYGQRISVIPFISPTG